MKPPTVRDAMQDIMGKPLFDTLMLEMTFEWVIVTCLAMLESKPRPLSILHQGFVDWYRTEYANTEGVES